MRTWMVVLTVVVCGAAPSAAQQRLSDVAGSIELKKPAGSGTVEVEVANETPRGRAAPRPAGGGLLVELTEDLRHYGAELKRLGREGIDGRYLEAEWRVEVAETIQRLEETGDDLRFLPTPEGLGVAYGLAAEGAADLESASEAMNDMLRSGTPRIRQVFELVDSAEEKLSLAVGSVRKTEERRRLEATSPAVDPVQAAIDIDALCNRRHQSVGSAFSRCVAVQSQAVQQMSERTWAVKPVSENRFNRIRNTCLREFPGDWEARDLCERQRIEDAAGAQAR